jgi:hypothetical protein
VAYEKVTLQISGDVYALSFTRPRPSGGDDTVIKFTVDTSGLKVTPNEEIDLASPLGDGSLRSSVSRQVSEDDYGTFPKVQRGRLSFETAPTAGAPVSGEVSVVFEQSADKYAGRAVYGHFNAQVQK